MLVRFRHNIATKFLLSKIFFSVVPLNLYSKTAINILKNGFFRFYSPSSAVIGLTYRCQCKCVHCSSSLYKKDLSKELTYHEIINLLDEIKEIGVPRINFSGGEALLRKDIFEIIAYASNKFITILESNGQLLNEDTVNKLKKSKISCVAVSIDSYKPSVHDNLRGLEDCFKYATAGISNCVKSKIPCLVSSYIPAERANPQDINNLMALARKLGVLAVRIMPPRPVGSFSCHTDSLLTESEEQMISRLFDPSVAYFKGIPAPKQCGIFTKATFYISPYGETQPCPYMPLSFGNIRKVTLRILLKRMWDHKIFNVKYRDCLILNEDFRTKNLQPILNKSLYPPLEI